VPDFADSMTTELERKVATLKWGALIETISYLILLSFWIGGNDIGTKLFGALHGMIFLAFSAMVLGVRAPMGWSWQYAGTVIVLGPVGSVMVYERIRRYGVPQRRAVSGGSCS
jgi:integral membrane protein